MLIDILEEVQSLTSKSYHGAGTISDISDKAVRIDAIDTFRNSTEPLIATARKTFQRTLCNSIFGDDSNTRFEPALKSIHPPDGDGAEIPTMDLPDEDVQTWFKHQVWRIVGWDVLIEYT